MSFVVDLENNFTAPCYISMLPVPFFLKSSNIFATNTHRIAIAKKSLERKTSNFSS